MKKNSITIIAVFSAIIVFAILTGVQNKILNQKPVMTVLTACMDISEDSELKSEFFKEVSVPLELVINTEIIKSISEISGMYAKERIHKGQILFKQDISSSDRLKIIKEVEGLERIAIKIKSSENAIAYQVKPKDSIHLYFSGRYGAIKETLKQYGLPEVLKNDNSMYTFCLLRDLEILGVYDSEGRNMESDKFSGLDTVVIATDNRNIEIINNLRTQGTFDITK